MATYVINHCDLVSKMRRKKMSREDFMGAVLYRAGKIVNNVVENLVGTKKKLKPSKNKGVEITATAVANQVIDKGAEEIASDMGISLKTLKEQASSTHISSC